jgi:hypothetical protein
MEGSVDEGSTGVIQVLYMYSTGTDGVESTWPIDRVQAALGEVAWLLRTIEDLLSAVYRNVPRPADLADREEGRLPYDIATDILGTLEGTLDEDLPAVIRRLERSAQITDKELAEEFRKRKEDDHGF